jgi:hypothetical protein
MGEGGADVDEAYGDGVRLGQRGNPRRFETAVRVY